ncbi:MAG: BLUF domain-containing protein [Betaproteobacteria bacterium]
MSFYIAKLALHIDNAALLHTHATMPQLFESIFLSELSSDVPPADIGNIVRKARAHHAAEKLSGLLLFDGERFCHYVEGAEQSVRHRITSIAEDERFTGFQQLHEGFTGECRRFDVWQVGILAPDGPSPLLGFATLRGNAAVDALLQLFHERKNHGIHVV